jgi:hypothetical protein
MMRKLPIGVQDFEKLRRGGNVIEFALQTRPCLLAQQDTTFENNRAGAVAAFSGL